MSETTFCTAINCMDGRFQDFVTSYLRERFGKPNVDMITEPGPDAILANGEPKELVDSIMARLLISVENHGSTQIAVIGHEDCAGNPLDHDHQVPQIEASMRGIREAFPQVEVLGLWVELDGTVEEIG